MVQSLKPLHKKQQHKLTHCDINYETISDKHNYQPPPPTSYKTNTWSQRSNHIEPVQLHNGLNIFRFWFKVWRHIKINNTIPPNVYYLFTISFLNFRTIKCWISVLKGMKNFNQRNKEHNQTTTFTCKMQHMKNDDRIPPNIYNLSTLSSQKVPPSTTSCWIAKGKKCKV